MISYPPYPMPCGGKKEPMKRVDEQLATCHQVVSLEKDVQPNKKVKKLDKSHLTLPFSTFSFSTLVGGEGGGAGEENGVAGVEPK